MTIDLLQRYLEQQAFEDNRDVHYDAIQKPQDPAKFIET